MESKGKSNGDNWKTVGVVVALLGMLFSWGYTAGAVKARTDENRRNISTLTANVQTIATQQTTITVSLAQTVESLRSITASQVRLEADIKELESSHQRRDE